MYCSGDWADQNYVLFGKYLLNCLYLVESSVHIFLAFWDSVYQSVNNGKCFKFTIFQSLNIKICQSKRMLFCSKELVRSIRSSPRFWVIGNIKAGYMFNLFCPGSFKKHLPQFNPVFLTCIFKKTLYF